MFVKQAGVNADRSTLLPAKRPSVGTVNVPWWLADAQLLVIT